VEERIRGGASGSRQESTFDRPRLVAFEPCDARCSF
jgi:hypothetical protein